MNAHADIQAICAFGLTEREINILQILADGNDYAEVAKRIGCAHESVKNFVREIKSKLGAQDRVHAVAIAMRKELIQ